MIFGWDIDVGYHKIIRVGKLIELLKQLPEDACVSAQTEAHTGNLSVLHRSIGYRNLFAVVHIGYEEVEYYNQDMVED